MMNRITLNGASRWRRLGGALLLGCLTAGCASQANISTDQLPLKRVVVYRNGVGYYERAGKVSEDEVRFKMRSHMIGDFLATLAIVERGGSSVRSASFPLDIEDDEAAEPDIDPRLQGMLKPYPAPEPEKKDDPDLRQVVLRLDGKEHDLAIGYVAETPVWRPSYRLVVHEDGSADLQAWGIVQNLSGEDWKQIKLVLVAGAPLAFESTLGVPVIPQRPVVTDEGEVIAAMPEGVTTLGDAPEPEAPMEEEAASGEALDDDEDYEKDRRPRAKKKMKSGKRDRYYSRTRSPAPPPAPVGAAAGPGRGGGGKGRGYSYGANIAELAEQGLSKPRNMQALAAVAVGGGTTRYAIPTPVTIPDESATMVLLISRKVKGEAMFLFSPDGGVPESVSHPFRVVRFTNETKGLLEKGPIAVFERGSFLGQGLLDPLPPRADATVPFALERSLAVKSKVEHDNQGSRLYKVEFGRIWIERDSVRKTTYDVKNGGGQEAKLLVKHPRLANSRLEKPPADTDDNKEQGHALVPVKVKAYGSGKLVVDERSPNRQSVGWTSALASTAVEAWLKGNAGTAEQRSRMKKAWEARGKLKTLQDSKRKLDLERNELERSAQQDRFKLQALEKNRFAANLKQLLTKRLTANTKRLEVVEKKIIEQTMALEEARIRFEDALKGLVIAAPKG